MMAKTIFALLLLIAAPPARAADLSVTPAVIDLKGQARDIISRTVVLHNLTDRKISFYPVVRNISAEAGEQEFLDPSRADFSKSLANWIQISRGGIELDPGERREIPFEIRVNLSAAPGIYHAAISFPAGHNRDAAEANLRSAPQVMVNFEIAEIVRENLQLKRFAPARRIFGSMPAVFEYEMMNAGDRTEIPGGEILIYDRTGREIGQATVNPEGVSIAPGAAAELASAWRGKGFGQYKAILSASYGAGSLERIQDTVFFWILPWPKLAFGAAALFFLALGGGLWLHGRYSRWHRDRQGPPRSPGEPPRSAVVDLRAPRPRI